MTRTESGLEVMEPEPVADETTPLLRDSSSAESPDALEAQAEQEQREHDVNTVPLAETPPTWKLVLTMSSLWLNTFFAALDSTIVATLSTSISGSLHSFRAFSWIAAGYMIANAAIQPLSGKLTDIYGRRAGLIFASSFFAAGTLICGLAETQEIMILGRLVAGAGGGCLNTISTFVGSDLIPLRKRGVWQGIGNIVYGVGMSLGGVFGGAINDKLGWRYAFYIQVPFIVVAGILAIIFVDVPVKEGKKLQRVDFLGAITLVTALVLFLIGINSGGNIVPWNHPLVYVSLPLSGLVLALFVYIEDHVLEPIIPVRLLLNRSVLAACLTNWFGSIAVFGSLYYVQIYYQVLGETGLATGLRLVPQSVGTAVGSLGAGLIMRATGKYIILNIFAQMASIASAACILATFNGGDSADGPLPFFYLFLGGLGYGSMLTVTLISLIASVEHKHQAVITSASYAFRSTGCAIGIAISSAVMQNVLNQGLWSRFGSEPNAAKIIGKIRESLQMLRENKLPPGWHDGVVDAYIDALRGVWVVVLGFAILTALASFFIRQQKLYSNIERN